MGAKLLRSPAAGAAAPPEPGAAEVATAAAPPAGMLASLPKPEDTRVGRQDKLTLTKSQMQNENTTYN